MRNLLPAVVQPVQCCARWCNATGDGSGGMRRGGVVRNNGAAAACKFSDVSANGAGGGANAIACQQ